MKTGWTDKYDQDVSLGLDISHEPEVVLFLDVGISTLTPRQAREMAVALNALADEAETYG